MRATAAGARTKRWSCGTPPRGLDDSDQGYRTAARSACVAGRRGSVQVESAPRMGWVAPRPRARTGTRISQGPVLLVRLTRSSSPVTAPTLEGCTRTTSLVQGSEGLTNILNFCYHREGPSMPGFFLFFCLGLRERWMRKNGRRKNPISVLYKNGIRF